MRLAMFLILILASSVIVSAQPQIRCFEFGALKDKHTIRFEADGGDIAGSYFIEREYDAEQAEIYDFSGTRAGSTLNVKFSSYAKLPNQPLEINSATLTLVKSAGGAEILRVKFFGRSKAVVSSLEMPPCESGASDSSSKPKRVTFAKGKTSATVNVTFVRPNVRQSFLLGAGKNQTISVFSPGCAIEMDYPNKTEYEENAQIDEFYIEKIPQTGDYLFVLSPAGETEKCPTTFEIKN